MSLEEKVKNQFIIKIKLPEKEVNKLTKKLKIPYCEALTELWNEKKESYKEDLKKSGAIIVNELSILNGYVVKAENEDILKKLKKKPYIQYIEKDFAGNFIPEK